MAITFEFETVDMKTEISTALQEALPDYQAGEVKILYGDPTSPAELPCIGINRVDDSESDQSISDSENVIKDNNDIYYAVKGTYFHESLEIRLWHTNAEERDRVYHIIKSVLFAKKDDLLNKGIVNITIRGGRDEQDNSAQYAPMPIYWAPITLTYLNPLDIKYITPLDTLTIERVDTKLTE